MEDVLAETLRILREARAKSARALVGYSGGKDSRAIADLCSRTFDEVQAFHMELVPGLECVDDMLEEGRKLFGFTAVHRYPHWMVPNLLREGIFCNPWLTTNDLPSLKLRDIWDTAIADTGIPMIVTGQKKKDGTWRKRTLKNTEAYSDVIHPLAGDQREGWSKLDVLSFLKMRSIPVPTASGDNTSGIDLTTPSLLWLFDTHPRDFERVCEVFPEARTVPFRREHYGVGRAA